MKLSYRILKYTTLITLPAVAWLGCKKSFLEVDPQGQLTETQILQDPNAARDLITGVYNTLYLGGFGNNTVGFLYALATDIASDDADKGSSEGDFGQMREIDNFTLTPNNFVLDNIWKGHYQGIARANQAINVLERSTFDDATKNRYISEARFIRGLYYFNLVRMFGGVPRVLRVPNATEANSDEFQLRATKEQIYEAIVADFQFAVDNLPMKGDALTQTGRANKGAAQAYLAKVYLYQKNWQKAFELSRDVINSGKYALLQNYAQIHREAGNNSIESVFEVQTGSIATCNSISPLYSNGQGARSKGGWSDIGFGFNTPTANLANAYSATDVRREATIIFIQPTVAGNSRGTVLFDGFRIPSQDSVENQRYNYKAYHSNTSETPSCNGVADKDNKPHNIKLMRYAEVLLIYAEAAAMLGNTGEATSKLTMVRQRANVLPVAGTQANIWEERRLELAMETDRFFDLVRQGRAGQVLRAHGKAFVDGKHELFPIPQAQRDLSGNRLTQNPGYQ